MVTALETELVEHLVNSIRPGLGGGRVRGETRVADPGYGN